MAYTFSVPNLPPKTYDFIRRAAKGYGLSQRQVVIAALDLLNDLGVEDKTRVEALFQRVREKHPSRAGRGNV